MESAGWGRGKKTFAWVALAAVSVLGISVVASAPPWGEAQTGTETPSPDASAPPPTTGSETPREASEPEDDVAEQARAEERLAQARTAAASLASGSDCQSETADSAVLSEFLELGLEEGTLSVEDAEVLERALSGLQSECSPTYAGSVFHEVQVASELDAASVFRDDVGTDWVDRSVSVAGASDMRSFITPDGNIACDFDGGLRCTAYGTNTMRLQAVTPAPRT